MNQMKLFLSFVVGLVTALAIGYGVQSVDAATYTKTWQATTTTPNLIYPLKSGTTYPSLLAPTFVATSTTATSTFPRLSSSLLGSFQDLLATGTTTLATTTITSLSVGSSAVTGASISLQDWKLSTTTTVCRAPEQCQYQADGVADNIQIDAAITAIASGGGGVVYIKKGLYDIAATVDYPATSTAVIGDGIGRTILKASASIAMMKLGIQTTGDWYVENVMVKGITFDLNSTGSGLNISNTRNVLVEEVEFKNSKVGGGGNSFQLVVGNLYTLTNPDGYAAYYGKDITIRNSIFRDNPHATVESINLEQAKNVLFEGNRCENVDLVSTNGGCLFTWQAEDVMIKNNRFMSGGGIGIDGRGPTTVQGNIFEDATLVMDNARNVTIQGNTFKKSTSTEGSGGIVIKGAFQGIGEGAWYNTFGPQPSENIVIDGNTFKNVHSTPILINGTYASTTDPTVFYPSCRSLVVSSNTFYQSRYIADIHCLNLTVDGNLFIENNQDGGSQTAGVELGGEYLVVTNNQAFVNSATTTQTYGIVFRNEIEEAGIIKGMTVLMSNNRLDGGVKYRHFGTSGSIQSTGNVASTTWIFQETNNRGTNDLISFMATSSSATSSLFRVLTDGSTGIGTTTPSTLFSIAGGTGIFASTTGTSTFLGGGINLVTSSGNVPCFAVNGTCLSGGTVGSGTTGQIPYYAGSGTTLTATSSLFIDANQRIGIGSTTPFHALALDIPWADTVNPQVFIRGADNEATTTAFKVVDENTFNLFRVYSDVSLLGTGVVQVFGHLLLNSSENSTTPEKAAIVIQSTSGDNGLYIAAENDSAKYAIKIDDETSGEVFSIQSLGLNTNAYTTVLSNSPLGIGTTTPAWNLQIATSSASSSFRSQLTLTDTNGGLNAQHWNLRSASGAFRIGTSSDAYATSTYFSIINGGNVGIGTTTPPSKLTISGHIGTDGTIPVLSAAGTSPSITLGSTDTAGEITEGTIATGAIITFAAAYINAPFCTVTGQSGLAFSYIVSNTAITIVNIGALSSTKLNYHCIANGG